MLYRLETVVWHLSRLGCRSRLLYVSLLLEVLTRIRRLYRLLLLLLSWRWTGVGWIASWVSCRLARIVGSLLLSVLPGGRGSLVGWLSGLRSSIGWLLCGLVVSRFRNLLVGGVARDALLVTLLFRGLVSRLLNQWIKFFALLEPIDSRVRFLCDMKLRAQYYNFNP